MIRKRKRFSERRKNMAEKDAAEKQTLEEQFAQLDDIIAKLDDPKIGLEDSFKLYKEGMNVLKKCNLSIDRVQKQLITLESDEAQEQ